MSTRDTTIEDSTLETESFVHFVHNRCAQMAPLSVADVEDLYSIRTAPECQLDRVTKEEVAHLDNICAQPIAGNKRRQKAKRISLNRKLHFSIYRKANSPRWIKMIEVLWIHSTCYQRISLDFRHDALDEKQSDIVSGFRVHLQSTVDLIREDIEIARMQPTHGKKLARV